MTKAGSDIDTRPSGAKRPYIDRVSAKELDDWFAKRGYPAYRRRQLASWLERQVTETRHMTDLPLALRTELEADFRFDHLEILRRQESADGETVKYLVALDERHQVETVSLRYRHGHSVCVSSQSGCRMGCTFCASSRRGFGRDLRAAEMLAQLRLAAEDRGERVSHVVLMGIGEPFDNYEETLDFIRRANAPEGFGIGARHITVSTVGLVPEIRRFANEGLAANLAVSLHAADDTVRRRLLPVARRYSLDELMAACRYYLTKTSRRLSYEYALFQNVNDQPAAADELASLLRGQRCHVNLIPANPVPGSDLTPSDPKRIERFRQRLEERHITVTVRRSLGGDIEAACGQLRRDAGS
ncbi:MAG: 23S rRNA (adenine(2503)-C(2))-methyltransferase RlmN [Bacillota bacterium]|nr:23S rRNA (adenine(2503)-C(2))-methyltransferase RlmN [Bacillota bacterium]